MSELLRDVLSPSETLPIKRRGKGIAWGDSGGMIIAGWIAEIKHISQFSFYQNSSSVTIMANLQASKLFSIKDRVVVITGGGSGENKSIISST